MKTTMNESERINELRNVLHQLNHNYYVLNKSTVSDREFDMMMHELQDLEARHPEMRDPNSPTMRVGSDLKEGFTRVTHQYPMLSLGNTYNEGDVTEFYGRVATELGSDFEVCCEVKFDGLGISLIYEDGRLVHAVTRGDGEAGDDVTANVKTIKSIPLVLQGEGWPKKFEMRGEILMPWASFERLNRQRSLNGEPLLANPRNAASGTLKLQSPTEVAARGLDAYLYYMLGEELPADNHYDNLQMAKQWGFKVAGSMKVVHSQQEVMDYISYWNEERKNLPVATDGIVLKVNNIRQQQVLGMTAKSPRWAIAYKFEAERALTKLEKVDYQVGRTGAVTPVAHLRPVQLSGTTVRKATLNNADFIRSLDLHNGDMVYVEKGGEIIPKITGVELSARLKGAGAVEFPYRCPVCGTPLVRYADEATYYCPNTMQCAPQIKNSIEHFADRKAMNIDGLGPETIAMMYDKGLLHDVADLYQLLPSQIMRLDGYDMKKTERIFTALRKSHDVPFERVLFAIGIRFVGAVVAKVLANHFKSIEVLSTATKDELLAVEGVGEVIAQSVVDFFGDPVNQQVVDRLKAAGLQMMVKEDEAQQEPASDKLSGKTIVISGVFALHSRDEYKELIVAHGGKNTGSISKKTDYVLAGENMGPSKLVKAQQLGVQIINEDEFLKMIG